ncbi:hypothetical protein NQ038_13510 [Brevibacterium sp. 50QC2O2]|uniref:RNA polymerase sigma factor n=1 Tax=Brevibacterium sp. 50QC2O2 TaxID=2968459 RepID=UPI00211C2E20|nr:sigma-70 family RNA polymerase sigma factor [Brevibacterium sp. 50QC2O2]MCQ9389654.1 hypothetical protein [Brevibacterium sp. 50QC2O2]
MPGTSHAALDAESSALEAVRTGDPTAFGPLWDAYHPRVSAFVRRRAPRLDAEDVASHVLEATLSATLRGLGPTRSVWSYLMQAARGEIARRTSALDHRIDPDEGFAWDSEPDPHEPVPPETTDLLRSVVESFPAQDRIVILEAMAGKRKTGAIAQDLGRDAPWVSRRIHKLRPRLQQRWIQLHVNDAGSSPECRKTLAQTGRVLSGQSTAGSALRFWTHVDSCEFCRPRVAEADHSSRRLGVLLPLLLVPAAGSGLSGTTLSGAAQSGATGGGGTGGGTTGSGTAQGASAGIGAQAGASTVAGGAGIFTALNVTLGAGALLLIAAIVTVVLIVLPSSPVHRPAAEGPKKTQVLPTTPATPAAPAAPRRPGADSPDAQADTGTVPQPTSAPDTGTADAASAQAPGTEAPRAGDAADPSLPPGTAGRGPQIGGDVGSGRVPRTDPPSTPPPGSSDEGGPLPTTTPCSWAPQLQCQLGQS